MVKGRGKTARVAASSRPAPRGGDAPVVGFAVSASRIERRKEAEKKRKERLKEVVKKTDFFLGLPQKDYPKVTRRHFPPPIATRAEHDAALARYGTPEEMQEKIEGIGRAWGMREEDVEDFRRAHHPDLFRSGEVSSIDYDRKLGKDVAAERAMEKMKRAIGEAREVHKLDRPSRRADDPPNVGKLLLSHMAYTLRMHPQSDAEWVNERAKVVFGRRGEGAPRTLAERHFGFGGRPVSLEKLSDAENTTPMQVKEIIAKEARELLSVRSVAELRNAADVGSGRRFLWPDERDGSYARNGRP